MQELLGVLPDDRFLTHTVQMKHLLIVAPKSSHLSVLNPHGSDETTFNSTCEPCNMPVLNPHGSDETDAKVIAFVREFKVLNPHGSDETYSSTFK